MLGASEFLAQVLPLFFQLVGIPILLGIAYFVYQKVYKPRQNPTEASQPAPITEQAVEFEPISMPSPIQSNDLPDLDMIVEPDLLYRTEDTPMTDNNPSSQPEQSTPQFDTSDLPPLDMLIGALEDEPAEDPAPPPVQEAPAQVVQLRTASQSTDYVQLSTGQIAPVQEVITILRDQDDGRLLIQVGNTGYRTLADSPAIKQLFTEVMKELAGTVTKPDASPPARQRYVVGDPTTQPKSMPKPSPTPAEAPMPSIRDLLVDDDDEQTPQPEARPKASTPPPPAPGGIMPGDLPSYKLDDNPLKTEKKGRFGGQKVEAEAPPELDLAAAIETYLQYKLQHTPEYIGRQIHIHGTPTGAIRIQVDEQYCDFVDEVADVEIRQFLQDTIAEWQERQ